MPTLTINGQTLSFQGKKSILQVALDHGIDIPYYCYHPGLSVVASCRICLVEIESPDPKDPTKLVKLPKLTPSCQTPAVDGMKVYSTSPKARANQQAVMEFLLLNHPLDCPVCDQAGECYLQDYSYKFGRAQSRLEEDKIKNPKKDIGAHILLYADRCIFCSRCVRFTREITGTAELAFFGRGATQEIDVFPGKPLNNPLAGNVVDICPVGALLDKDFLFTQRVWFLRSTPSISPANSGCENIFIHHNEGRIYRIKPRPNPALNQWWISDEARYTFAFVHENRLRTPERTQYGSNTQTSWDHAYAQVLEELRTAAKDKGPGSLAALLSPFDSTEEMFLQARFIRAIDPQAWLVLNPSVIKGEDQVFKNPQTGAVTFTLKAEKAPNRVGGEKILAHFAGNTCDFPTLAAHLKARKITALLVSSDPFPTNDDDQKKSLTASALIVLASRKGPLYDRATISLPACTWAEKDGIYENFQGQLQAFRQAIPPLENARPAGRIFWDLLGLATSTAPSAPYAITAVRQLLADAGRPQYAATTIPEELTRTDAMQFAEL